MENAKVSIYDPKVPFDTIVQELSYVGVPKALIEKNLHYCGNALEALDQAHAMVVLTEWDEFRDLDFVKIHHGMFKPAFAFDGRNILPRESMLTLGFQVYNIGVGN
jgi:UDPglucose 6-dehydrogenase